MALSNLYCKRHPQRDAAVKCLGCESFYCHECVIEHEERYLCQSCISKQLPPVAKDSLWRQWLFLLLGGIAGFTFIFIFFYIAGKILLAIPNHFHQGDLW